jgi:FixJ family two-component response regulator
MTSIGDRRCDGGRAGVGAVDKRARDAYPTHMANANVQTGLTDREREVLRAAVAARGERAVAALLGIPRNTFVRLLAGLAVRRGTLLLARSSFSALEADSVSSAAEGRAP